MRPIEVSRGFAASGQRQDAGMVVAIERRHRINTARVVAIVGHRRTMAPFDGSGLVTSPDCLMRHRDKL